MADVQIKKQPYGFPDDVAINTSASTGDLQGL